MIWLIGNKGMLGTELSLLFEENKIPFVGTDREVDILSPEALAAFAKDKDIGWIVNCAAYTAVDKAEDEEALCRAINAEGPKNIAQVAQSIGAAVLHISTDYVFAGTADSPYPEDAPAAPTGVYGKTKADGEQALRETLDRHVIIRTAWLYGKHGPNFVYTMLRLMKERDSLGVVADQIGSPTWAFDLAKAILSVVTSSSPSWGTYHYTNGGQCSWHDFALEIQRLGLETSLLDKTIPVKALSTADYPTKAKRPAWSVLSKDKIARDYGVTIPGWKESLATFIKGIAKENE